MTDTHNPTPSEMMTLLHWWLMVWSGAVLACDGLADVRWWSIPARQWHVFYAPDNTSSSGTERQTHE